jgi:hypothetical protein
MHKQDVYGFHLVVHVKVGALCRHHMFTSHLGRMGFLLDPRFND